jgi:Fe-S cluster assembly protein SufD
MNAAVRIPSWLLAGNVNDTSQPQWLREYRAQHWQAFLQRGLPTRQEEHWKYADMVVFANKNFHAAAPVKDHDFSDIINQYRLQRDDSILLVFVNGQFMPMLSDLAKLPSTVIACPMNIAWQQHAELLKKHWPAVIDVKRYPFAAWNAGMFNEGLFFYLPANMLLTSGLHFLYIVVEEETFAAHPQHLFVLGDHSQATMLSEHVSLTAQAYLLNSVTTIHMGKQAKLEHCKIQQEGKQAIHLAHTFVQQQADSHSNFTQFSSGANFARDELTVQLTGTGAQCQTSGFYHLYHDEQYIDHHVDITHAAPHTQSEMLYKGILQNKSRAVFNGRLHVTPGAVKIVSQQTNHNLLLSKQAEAYTKPELEIYADDVQCKHGATVGQLEQDALFYLRARGIEYTEAITMLLAGFAADIKQRVTHAGIQKRVEEIQ